MPVEEIVERAAGAEKWLAENCSREEFIRSGTKSSMKS
jgi:hypothetical protein